MAKVRIAMDEESGVPSLMIMIGIPEILKMMKQNLGLNLSSLAPVIEETIRQLRDRFFRE